VRIENFGTGRDKEIQEREQHLKNLKGLLIGHGLMDIIVNAVNGRFP
jgi:hypothetical protein